MTRLNKSSGSVKDKLPLIYFILSLLLLSFVAGLFIGQKNRVQLDALFPGLETTLQDRKNARRPSHVVKARYHREGATLYYPAQVLPGLTLITAPFREGEDWNLELRLIDLQGDPVHRWNANPERIWSESPHQDVATGSKDEKHETYVHGSLLFPNGDVVFNLEYLGCVRMDWFGNVLWKLPYRTHHSLFQDHEGRIWSCGQKWHEQSNPDWPGLDPPFVEDTILELSPDGRVLSERSVLDILYQSGYQRLMFLGRLQNTGDVLHLNDVEILGPDKAEAFDRFQAGDILISCKHIHTVMVLDGRTNRVKWSLTHPFFGQHDPDFTADGQILVFNNDYDRSDDDSTADGSQILRVDPDSHSVSVVYGDRSDEVFFTELGGKHQILSNGNTLITEAGTGRVFEINRDREVVWEWVMPRWDETGVAEVLEGTRYPSGFLDRYPDGNNPVSSSVEQGSGNRPPQR
jgi:hypothetical protein